MKSMVQEFFVSGNCEPNADSPEGISLRTFASGEGGARGFATGTASFRGDAELPYHVHNCSEAITILSGDALVIVGERGYLLGRLDCMHIPAEVPHTIRNIRADREMV